MKAGRKARPSVREENLRGYGTRGSWARLSAWRGRSGRRYVVVVQGIDTARTSAEPGSVILGVRRDSDGIATIVGAGHRGSVAEAIVLARLDRATEIHIHTLAETDAEREAIIEDLVGDDVI